MINELQIKEEIMKGDYRNEAEDAYVKLLESDSKKNKVLRIGMLATYTFLLIVSILVI